MAGAWHFFLGDPEEIAASKINPCHNI